MNEGKEKKRYLVKYKKEGEGHERSSVVLAKDIEDLNMQVAELMQPEPRRGEVTRKQEPEYPLITELRSDTMAALVEEAARHRLNDLAKYGHVHVRSDPANIHKLEGFKYRELAVNQTSDPNKYCLRMLVNKDSLMIEHALRRGFAVVEDIGTSADNQDPEGIDKGYPTAEGFHEWVCILEPYKAVIEKDDVPRIITVQQAITWFDNNIPNIYHDALGEYLDEDTVTDEELLALLGSGEATLETLSHELGGEEYLDHRDLCEDSYKWIGGKRYFKLVEVTMLEAARLQGQALAQELAQELAQDQGE